MPEQGKVKKHINPEVLVNTDSEQKLLGFVRSFSGSQTRTKVYTNSKYQNIGTDRTGKFVPQIHNAKKPGNQKVARGKTVQQY